MALACGGTGGHIFPGIATAKALEGRGHEVVLWLVGKSVEATAAAGWKGRAITVPAEGLPTGLSMRAVRAGYRLVRAVARCRDLMRHDRPDVVLAMGSYASAGPAFAALLLRIPLVLHESNVIPGRATVLLSRWASAVAGCFEETRYYIHRKTIVITGMPLREELRGGQQSFPLAGLDRSIFTLLVMGGSQGAHKLNDVVSQAVAEAHGRGVPVQAVHLTGQADEAAVRAVYEKAGVRHVVKAFTQDMASVYSAADLAICRSGAATCAELSAYGLPALLVPFPSAARDHQTANARALEKIGAADMVREADLYAPWLVDYLVECVDNPGRLAKMSAASKKRPGAEGTAALADLVESAAGRPAHEAPARP